MQNVKFKKIIYTGLMGILFLSISGAVFAQGANNNNEEKKIIKRTTNEISGEISVIGKDSIAIIYERDKKNDVEYEMLVLIDTSTKLERKKSLAEFNIGDTVKIQFEDTTSGNVSGEQRIERKAKVISFVNPAANKLPMLMPPEPGDGIADDTIFQKLEKK